MEKISTEDDLKGLTKEVSDLDFEGVRFLKKIRYSHSKNGLK